MPARQWMATLFPCSTLASYIYACAAGRCDIVRQPVVACGPRQDREATGARIYPVWIHKKVDL
jgi:hypothetical protein